ncbi:SfiI-subtelomeric fragment related protein family member, putative [Theileria annulata]|uniref:SfiI-subtelomeric related protein family member, putative n=1 Tax=Theileria annulata TaxID=5874 RepID=Q4UBK9_THEAN|nr:SfiI-subtelomeric fragment related protein family member, putative [Theileria annulata]CAI75792.1 SfiI-subtelomeric fragment related protein family member, putative [Theileria annulata]
MLMLISLPISSTTDHNGVITYTPKPGNVFSKLVDGATDIWESKPGLYGTLVRTMTSNGVRYLAVLLDNNMFKLFKLDDDNWKDITTKRYDVSNLKFLGESDTELTKKDYAVTLTDDMYEYKFNDGVNCRKITYNDMPVWKHTDDPNFSEIRSLSLDLPRNKFLVMKNLTNYSTN